MLWIICRNPSFLEEGLNIVIVNPIFFSRAKIMGYSLVFETSSHLDL